LYLLIPIALVFVAIAVRILFWAINSGQYDNLDTEAHRILFDDDPEPPRSAAPTDSMPSSKVGDERGD
jgi:cbb3-type cytochrome oxidase maturation protein